MMKEGVDVMGENDDPTLRDQFLSTTYPAPPRCCYCGAQAVITVSHRTAGGEEVYDTCLICAPSRNETADSGVPRGTRMAVGEVGEALRLLAGM